MIELWDDIDYMAEEIISSRIYNWETRGDFPAEKSPFQKPSIFEGYPMNRKDKRDTKKSLENIYNG